MPISIKTAKKFFDAVPWSAVGKKAGSASKGDRLWPAKSKDTKLNFRLDKGAKVDDHHHEVILQANKGAEDPEVKKSAAANSHRIVAKATLDPKNVDASKVKEKLTSSFKENNK